MSHKKLNIFLFICLVAFHVSAKPYDFYKWTPIDENFDSIARILESVSYYDFDRSEHSEEIQKLRRIGNSENDNQLKARADFWEAWYNSRSNSDHALNLINRTIAQADDTKYLYDNARFRYIKADILRVKGKWSDAYILFKDVEKYFNSVGDYFWQARSCVSIGSIFQKLDESKEALRYFKKANDLFDQIGCDNCRIKNRINISNNLYILGKKAEALKILKELEQESVVQQDTLFMVNVLISIFSVSDQQEINAAYKAYDLIKKMRYTNLYSLAEMTLASEMKSQEKNDSALIFYRMAWLSAQRNNDVYHKPNILKGMSETFFNLGQADSAYHYMNLANVYQDSLISHNKIMELSRMENRTMLEQYEADLRFVEESAAYQRNIAIMVGAALILLIGLVCYILWLSRRKAKMSEQLKDVQNRELILQNKQHLLEIESMSRELSSNTLIIAQKNAKLKELYEQIETMAQSGNVDDKVSKELKNSFKSQIIADEEWTYFVIKFEKIYPNFFTKLKQQFPNLSETELRLCAYIRIGMSAKEIAKILSVQPETVNTSRYRMRKKMKLTSGQSLEDLIRFI